MPNPLYRRRDLRPIKHRNALPNSVMSGYSAGAPGTVPRGWDYNYPDQANGVTAQIVGVAIEDGVTCLDWQIAGTSTGGTGPAQLDLNWGVSGEQLLPTKLGDAWMLSCFFKLVSGAVPTALFLRLDERDASNSILNTTQTNLTPSSTARLLNQRASVSATMVNATAAKAGGVIGVTYPTGSAFSLRILIGLPQLERGLSLSSPERVLRV